MTRHYPHRSSFSWQWILIVFPLLLPMALSQSVSMPTMASYMASNSTLTTLAASLERIGLLNQLAATNVALTLFAPTDASFSALVAPFTLYIDQDQWLYHLQTLLMFHMASDVLTIAQIFDGIRLDITSLASSLPMSVSQRARTIDEDAYIVKSDVHLANGIIQVPDRVLIPPFMKTSLRDLVIAGKLTDAERPYGASYFSAMIKVGQEQDSFDAINAGGLTVMVPTDAAFADDNSGLVDELFAPGNENITKMIVQYHTAPYNLYVQRVSTMEPPQLQVQMSNGVTAWFTVNDNQLQVNGARFVVADDLRGNGVAHFIDQFLVPPTVKELMGITTKVTTFSFKSFLQALAKHSTSIIDNSNGEFVTVFAPLASAFEQERSSISRWELNGWEWHYDELLKNHFAYGWFDIQQLMNSGVSTVAMSGGYDITVNATDISGNITVGGDAVVMVDNLFATDGVIHGIDRLLIPPPLSKSIYQQLRDNPDFSILVQMIDGAGLQQDLDYTAADETDTPLTLLAPPNQVLEGIDTSDYSAIRAALESHIFPVNHRIKDLLQNNTTTTSTPHWTARNGVQWTITKHGGSIYVGSSRLGMEPFVDQLASNGVIQTIDRWSLDTTPPILNLTTGSTTASSTPTKTIAPTKKSFPPLLTLMPTSEVTSHGIKNSSSTVPVTSIPANTSSTTNPFQEKKPSTKTTSASQYFAVSKPPSTPISSSTNKKNNHDMLILLLGLVGLAIVAAVALGALMMRQLPRQKKLQKSLDSESHHHHHHHHHHHQKEKFANMV